MKLLAVHEYPAGAELFIVEEKIIGFKKPIDRGGLIIHTIGQEYHVIESLGDILRKPKKPSRLLQAMGAKNPKRSK
jgi:hypothetical protein